MTELSAETWEQIFRALGTALVEFGATFRKNSTPSL
jgi:hypothetical protein